MKTVLGLSLWRSGGEVAFMALKWSYPFRPRNVKACVDEALHSSLHLANGRKNGENFRHENQKSDAVLLYFQKEAMEESECCVVVANDRTNLDLSWNVTNSYAANGCELDAPICGGSAMNFGGELQSFSLTKVSGFYFVFSICWLPFASLLLVSFCFPLGVLLSAAQYTMVQCGKSCYLHRRDAVTRIGGKQWTGGKHKIRNPNPAWKCKRVMHHKICPSQKFGSKTLLPKAACLDNQTFLQITSLENMKSAPTSISSLCHSPPRIKSCSPPKKLDGCKAF